MSVKHEAFELNISIKFFAWPKLITLSAMYQSLLSIDTFFLPYIILFPLSSWYVYGIISLHFFFTCVSVCSSSFLVFFFHISISMCAPVVIEPWPWEQMAFSILESWSLVWTMSKRTNLIDSSKEKRIPLLLKKYRGNKLT